MKKYLVDTNIVLRFLLKDNLKLFNQSKKYFSQAKEGKVILILLPQIVFEMDYVLKGVYSLAKKERIDILSNLVKSPDLKVDHRKILIEAIEKYKKIHIDLVDLYLWEMAKQQNAEVLSFDKDFKRIKQEL